MSDLLLRVRDLSIHFGLENQPVRAVDGVSFDVSEGQCIALVGESGSGKSVTALSLARLMPSPPARWMSGSVVFSGLKVETLDSDGLRRLRGAGIAYVFQEPGSTLNPTIRIGRQIEEAARLHVPDVDPAEEALRLMARCGLPDPPLQARSYPHELSGGMQQRAVIAMALACRPRLLVADEPTTALDVSIQAQILRLVRELQTELNMAVLLITHNLGIVSGMADTMHVMYAGQIVESGPAKALLRAPAHPYTAGLVAAVPRLGHTGAAIEGIPGTVPPAYAMPAGCRFHPRCPRCESRCRDAEAETDKTGGRSVRCHFPLHEEKALSK